MLRAHVDEDSASEVLQDLYAAHPENEQIEQALSDTSFGIVTTTAPESRRAPTLGPGHGAQCRGLRGPRAHERKSVLLHEAELQLAEFIGLDEVKTRCRG